MSNSDGSIVINTRIDTKGFQQGTVNMQSQFSKLAGAAKKLGLAMAGAFGVSKLVQFGKEAIELGSDLAEVQNVVDVTFGSLNGTIDKFAKNAIRQFGLSELSAKQYSSTMGAMLKSMGLTTDQAAAMSMQITGLAGDMASFYNLSGDDAFAKLRAGISGETEPLKQLGINLSVANLEQYALAKGITKTYDAMSEQEKVLLRYNYLLSVTSDAQGDFARTSNSWANQTKILSEHFNSLKATIGQGLINVLTPVLTVINTILAGLQAVANAFRQFTALLFGDAGGVAQQAQDIASGFSDAAGGASDLAGETGKAAKEAKKFLAGFDEITKVSEKSGSGGSGSGGAGGIGSVDFGGIDLGGSEPVEDNISPQIQAIVDKCLQLIAPLKEIDFAPLKESLASLGGAFGMLGEMIVSGLEWAWFNILIPLAGWVIEDALPASIDLLSEALDFLLVVIEGLQPLASWLWESFLKPIAEWTGDLIVDSINLLTDALSGFSEWISNNQESVEVITTTLGIFMALWKATDLIMWIDAAGGVTKILKDLTAVLKANTIAKLANKAEDIAIIALYLKDYIVAFAGFISNIAKSTAAWVANTAAKVASTAAEWAQIAATTAWNAICAAATAVTTAFGAAMAFLTSPIGLVVVAITALIAIIVLLVKNWDTVKAVASQVWDGIKQVWGNVSSWFKTKVLDPLYKGFKGVVNSIIGFLNGMISGLCSGINAAIKAINKLNVTVPDWIPGIGGKRFGFNLKTVSAPKIPYLAKGAVIPPNAPFLAMLGDQKHGTNIEAPLATIEAAVERVMSRHSGMSDERIIFLLTQLLEAVLSIEIDGEVIAKAIDNYRRKEAVSRG